MIHGTLSQALFRRAQRSSEGTVRLHRQESVGFTVHVDHDGSIKHIHEHPKPQQGEQPYTTLLPQLTKARTSNVSPILISDNGQYVLGGNDSKTTKKHDGYLKMLAKHDHPLVNAVRQAVSQLHWQMFGDDQESVLAAKITFLVSGVNPHEQPEIQAFWQDICEQTMKSGKKAMSDETEYDAVTGEAAPLTPNAQTVSRIRGGQANVLYQSANNDAFKSYGKITLGVSKLTMEAITRALQELTKNPDTCFQDEEHTLLHWLESDPSAGEHDPWVVLSEPNEKNVHELLTAAEQHQGEEQIVNVAILTGQSSRLMVREYAQLPLHEAARHATHYLTITQNLSIEQARREIADTKKVGNKIQYIFQPKLNLALQQHALLGYALPMNFRTNLIRKWNKQKSLTPAQTRLLTLTFKEARNMQDQDTIPAHLKNPYLLGKYAAVADHAHRRANQKVAKTVTDRFLQHLILRPDFAFVQMQSNLQNVIRNIRSRQKGLEIALEREIAAVCAQMTLPLPNRLNAEEQSALILGYQHERERQNEARRIKQAEKEMAQAKKPD